MSKRNPVKKVCKSLNAFLSTSPKSHTKRLRRTMKEIDKKSRTNAFSKAKRSGNILDQILANWKGLNKLLNIGQI